jgi:gliding motility-associated-like protein
MIGTGKGSPDISPTAFLVDKCNNIYISGWGSNLGGSLSTLNLPVTFDAYQNTTDGNDFYLAVINENLDSLEYATYFGGSLSTEHVDGGTSRFDKNGVVYQSVCAGCGNNNDFPIYPNPGAISATNNSTNCNNAVFKFDFKRPIVVADFSSPILNCTTVVNFINTSSTNQLNNISYYWDFGDGNFSNSINPIHQYQNTGVYSVKLIITSPQACNISDTIYKSIYVLSGTNDSLPSIIKCPYSLTQIGLPSINDSNLIFSWTPLAGLNNTNTSNPFSSSDTNIIYQLIISGNQCNDTLTQQIVVNNLIVDPPDDTSYCNLPILLDINPTNNLTNILWSSDNLFSDTLSDQLSFTAYYPQTVYIKANDSLCLVIDSVSILADLIDVKIDSDTLVCFGDTAILSVINNTPINPIISYNWAPSDFDVYNLDSSIVQKKLLSSTWYSLEVVNSAGCIIKDSVFITSFPLPVLDSLWANENNLIVGSTAIINALSSDSLIWFNNSSLSQISFPANFSNWYDVSVFNSYCFIRDSIYISVRDLFCNEDSIIIPTGFTPNDDGINDVYKIQNNGVDIINFELIIYNRLGQLVYTSNNINNFWDGIFKGNKLQPQVFDFYLEMTCYGGKVFFRKGNITLIK